MRVASVTSSLGYVADSQVLILLAGEALEPHPAVDGCEITADADYAVRVAG
jgi:hypothetical protein